MYKNFSGVDDQYEGDDDYDDGELSQNDDCSSVYGLSSL